MPASIECYSASQMIAYSPVCVNCEIYNCVDTNDDELFATGGDCSDNDSHWKDLPLPVINTAARTKYGYGVASVDISEYISVTFVVSFTSYF